MNVTRLPPLREVIARHGLRARKALGQHFILDLNLTRKIARAVPDLASSLVYEVGPGPGGLTRSLLAEGAREIIAAERDTRCRAALEEIAATCPGRLQIVEADALEIDEAALVGAAALPVQVAGNLPYNIGTALLLKWLAVEPWPPWYRSLTLMFQREVAERILAGPGSKAYGRLTVLAQWRTRVRGLFEIPGRAFTPPPKVDSRLLQFLPRANPVGGGLSARRLGALTRAAFGQRRKMLKSSLKSLGPETPTVLEKLGIDPRLRAEELTVAQFCRIAMELEPESSD